MNTREYWMKLRMEIEELRGFYKQSHKAAPEFPTDKRDESLILLSAATRNSATRFLDFWPGDYTVLEVEYSYEDGELSLQAYKDNGQTVGGIHFKDGKAWYTVTDYVTSVDSGYFNPGDDREIEKVVGRVVRCWKKLGVVV